MQRPPAYTGLARVWHALFYSLSGLRHALREESAFRQEAVLIGVLTGFALWLPISRATFLSLVLAQLLVLIVELLNSSIESVVDKVSPEFHVLAKNAKDMGSAAVLLSLLYLGLCWSLAIYECFAPSVAR